MVNPTLPHVIGITLDSDGVAVTQVVFTNFTTGEQQKVTTDASKRAIIDAANFDSGYTDGDVIGVENVGASIGGETVTIDTSAGMQIQEIDAAAASTTSNIGM